MAVFKSLKIKIELGVKRCFLDGRALVASIGNLRKTMLAKRLNKGTASKIRLSVIELLKKTKIDRIILT
jgi:hypothetical protein